MRSRSRFCFVYAVVFGNLGDSHFSRVQLMIDSSAVGERNVLIPLILNKGFHLFLGFLKNKSPDIMVFIKKISDFKFFHAYTPLRIDKAVFDKRNSV